MNSDNINEKDKFEPLNKELLDYIKFITEKTEIDYENFVENLKESEMFQEFEELIEKYNESEDKENLKFKIKAFMYRLNYKYREYKNSICSEKDYKLFIQDLERLIEKSIEKEKDITLELLWNFLMIILTVLEKEKRLPLEIATSSLTKNSFDTWVKEKIKELKHLSPEQMKFLIHREILDVEGPVWEKFRELKGKFIEDDKMKFLDAKTLVDYIKDHYESFRVVNGMIIGLFDLIDGKFDRDLKRSYFGDKFNTDDGFYSCRKIQPKNRLKKDNRPTLKEYIKKYDCQGFNDFFIWLIEQIKPIRLTGAHHQPFIEQKKITENKYSIKYKEGIKDVDIGFLRVCNEFLISILTTVYLIVSYFFYLNVEISEYKLNVK